MDQFALNWHLLSASIVFDLEELSIIPTLLLIAYAFELANDIFESLLIVYMGL